MWLYFFSAEIMKTNKIFLLAMLSTIVVTMWCSIWWKDSWNSLDNQKNSMNNQWPKTIVSSWDTVAVDYVWKLEDNTLFDTSIEQMAKENWLYSTWRKYSPLEFKVWAWMMIKWFDAWVVGMKVWETKKLTLAPADAYWEYSTWNIHNIPVDMFKQAWMEPVVGQDIVVWMWQVGKILEVNWDNVSVDFNHRLAGKTLIFEVTLKNIK